MPAQPLSKKKRERECKRKKKIDRRGVVEVAYSNFVYAAAKLFKQNSQVATHSGSLDSIMRAAMFAVLLEGCATA